MVKNGEFYNCETRFTIKIIHHFSPFFTILIFQFSKFQFFRNESKIRFNCLLSVAAGYIVSNYERKEVQFADNIYNIEAPTYSVEATFDPVEVPN